MPSSEIERSGFFNAQLKDGTYDREYEAEDFSKYFELFFGDGVFINPADQLMVKASSGLTISIKTGTAFIRGHYYELMENKTIKIGASASPRRVDVVLELSMTNRTIVSKLVETAGTGGFIPALTAPTNTENIRQLKLATIPIPAGTSTITDSMITDLRPNEVYCGYVKGAIESIETGDLFQQFTNAFNTWFEEIKGKLSTEAAGNLQLQIDQFKVQTNNSIEQINENIEKIEAGQDPDDDWSLYSDNGWTIRYRKIAKGLMYVNAFKTSQGSNASISGSLVVAGLPINVVMDQSLSCVMEVSGTHVGSGRAEISTNGGMYLFTPFYGDSVTYDVYGIVSVIDESP